MKEYSEAPPPEAFKKLSDKGWFKCRIPTRIIIDQSQIISARFIGHAKMCCSNPLDWPAPMVSLNLLFKSAVFLEYNGLTIIFYPKALYCVYLKRYKSKNE